MRVALVGGGVLGLATAWHLHERGAEVTLFETVGPGSGTTSRGAGLVCEGMWHPTSLALVRRSGELLRGLSARAESDGSAFRYHEVGSTTLVPPRLAEAARRIADAQRAQGADARVLAPDAAARLPRHDLLDMSGIALAVHYPRDGWATPRLYCEQVWSMAKASGMRMSEKAATLTHEGGRVRVEGVESDAVVVAAGMWTRALLRSVGLDAPLVAYRTQAQRFAHPRGHELPILHDAVQGCYLRPGEPGQLLVGNGTTTRPEDIAHWDAAPDASFVLSAQRRLAARVPRLADARATEGWAGLDTATPDRLLLAGAHPHAEGLWLLAGGNGHGFMRGPAAGEALAARILGASPRIDISAYDPARLAPTWEAAFVAREGYTLEP